MQADITDNRIYLCYCGNKKVFPLILMSLLSVAKHTRRPVTAYLVTMDLTEEDLAYMPISENQGQIADSVLKEGNAESAALLIDAKSAYLRRFADSKNRSNAYTPYAQLRLLLDELSPSDKLIYLDVDIMCCSDISALWDIDVSGHEYAAVKDHMGRVWINRKYCNSGVLLLNMKLIRETAFFERTIAYIRSHKMMMPDQTALNKLAKNKLILPRRFNEQRGIKEDTVLKHFCRGIKWYPFFFIVYNYKQTERKKVHEKLGIYDFDDIYEKYDEIALARNISE